jgi:hypothetical protein
MEGNSPEMFRDKQRGEGAQFFRRWDEELVLRNREQAEDEAKASAVGEALKLNDRALIERVMKLGVTPESATAFLLVPLVKIAWAEGKVQREERDTIFAIAREDDITSGSPGRAKLEEWLARRPAAELFDAAEATIRAQVSTLPDDEREERIDSLVALCRRVAEAAGGNAFARALGVHKAESRRERAVWEALADKLRGQGAARWLSSEGGCGV